jgi:tetratricopeptide (TPR) repeat protein
MHISMKRAIFIISAVIAIIGFVSLAAEKPSEDLKKYVCTTRRFAVPESFDAKDVEQCKLLVKANPQRFEAHATLAVALTGAGQFEEALDEFRRTDELSSAETDRTILASLPYEDVYVSTLFAAAAKRCAKDGGDLYALRMLQQALGMGESELRKHKQLSKCYTMMAHLYLRRGLYEKSVEACTQGIEAAKAEGNDDLVPVLEQGLSKARELQSKQSSK